MLSLQVGVWDQVICFRVQARAWSLKRASLEFRASGLGFRVYLELPKPTFFVGPL